MKTLLFTLEYPPFKGGVANFYGNLIKYYPVPDEIFVLHNNDNKLISNFLYPKWLPAFLFLYKKIKKNNIEHVIVGHILPLGTVTYYLSKILKIKYTVFLHGMDFTYACKPGRKQRITKKILAYAQNIICSNSYTAELVNKFVSEKNRIKIKVVNPGIEAEYHAVDKKFRNNIIEKYKLDNKFVIFTVGRLVKRKGIDTMIEAMEKIIERAPNVYYFIAGTGPDEKYLKNLKDTIPKNIREHIIFLGEINEKEKWVWFNLCKVFCMPNRTIEIVNGADFEGFGIVFLEAALAGKPAIAGRSGGVEDAVVDYETGILVDPESIDDIAGSIIELYNKPMLRQELGENALRRTLDEFGWKGKAMEIYRIIN